MINLEGAHVEFPEVGWEERNFAIEVVVPTQNPIEALRVGLRVSNYLKEYVFEFGGPVDILVGLEEEGQVAQLDGVVVKKRKPDDRPDSELSAEDLQIRKLVSQHLAQLQSPE